MITVYYRRFVWGGKGKNPPFPPTVEVKVKSYSKSIWSPVSEVYVNELVLTEGGCMDTSVQHSSLIGPKIDRQGNTDKSMRYLNFKFPCIRFKVPEIGESISPLRGVKLCKGVCSCPRHYPYQLRGKQKGYLAGELVTVIVYGNPELQ